MDAVNTDLIGNTVIRNWTPTPEQFENYKKREVELARHNIKGLTTKYDRTSVGILRQLTLHSEQSIIAALKTF